MGRKSIDLTGKKFERLTVIERVENNKYNQSQWLCQCDCNGENSLKIILGNSLIRKLTKSCGCLRKENPSKIHKKYNTYDLSGEYGIGYTSKGEEFYFDLEDYDKIKDYCWNKDDNGYILFKTENEFIRMHRLVMNCPDDMEVDHIYHVNHDNRKSELRIVTGSQNQMNKKLSTKNTSGVKGVYWSKGNKKWIAQITINYQKIYLGGYDSFNEAVKARLEAEQKYHTGYRYNPEGEETINL